MKTSLKKLRGFALHRHGEGRNRDDRRLQQPLAQLDELARATQDMQDMRDCYDSLLAAAAATANSAYEFSESLREMGGCLLEKTALNEDEESGRVLLMLGKLQFEIQKLVDNYRSHIFQTITIPSESLLNELLIVEEMKRLCDEKREVYDYMVSKHREKGRSKSSKGETFSTQQLQTARDAYDEEATLFVFRLKSLKRGQSRSLLTQAARHHAAQLGFFKKALKSIEMVEPHVKSVAEMQHIDYQFSGLEDYDGDDGDNDDPDDGYDTHDDGELSFDYGQNDQDLDVSSSRNSMELDNVDLTFPQVVPVNQPKENLYKIPGGDSFAFGRDMKLNSQSAPLFAEKKIDPAERYRQLRQSSTRKFLTYALPTPLETMSRASTESDTTDAQTRRTSLSVGGAPLNIWHSSPLEQRQHDKTSRNEKTTTTTTTMPSRLPPPLAEALSAPQGDVKNNKRQAFSGPLSSKSWSKKAVLYASGPIPSGGGHPQLYSGPLLRTPLPQPSSSPPKLSPNASPTFVSSPKISELHELPRPPAKSSSVSFAARPSNFIGYSCPLVSKVPEQQSGGGAVSKVVPSGGGAAASPLPTPPLSVSRSFSIPSRGQRRAVLPVGGKPLEEPHNYYSRVVEDIASPPLTPISLSNIQPSSSSSETLVPPPTQSRGAG